jgi:hypothetical protein
VEAVARENGAVIRTARRWRGRVPADDDFTALCEEAGARRVLPSAWMRSRCECQLPGHGLGSTLQVTVRLAVPPAQFT